MELPVITVITSCLNASGTLERCIRSVYEQKLADAEEVEHIIIDGASTDGTTDIIKKYRENLAFSLSEPDSGIYDAWNKAIPHARGEWILFLGADDYLYDSDALARIIPSLKSAWPAHPVVYGKLVNVYANGEKVAHKNNRPWEELKGEYDLPTGKYPPHPATFHHRSLFNGEHSFDSTYKYAADNLFMGRVVKHKDPLFVDSFVTCFSMEGATNNRETELLRWLEKNRARRELNLQIPWTLRIVSFLKVLLRWLETKFAGLR